MKEKFNLGDKTTRERWDNLTFLEKLERIKEQHRQEIETQKQKGNKDEKHDDHKYD